MIQKERILILRTYKHSEADLIVHGLNSLGARLNLFARGAAKSRKRFGGGLLEPTHFVEVTYKVSASGDSDPLHSLIEAHLIREFQGLRKDYSRLELALHMLKLAHKLGQQGVIDSPDLFNLLGHGLAAAENSENLAALRLQFELKVLASQGVLPPDDAHRPWLKATLAQHEQIEARPQDVQWLHVQVHDQLRHYLGTL